jgi:hypothetical protein
VDPLSLAASAAATIVNLMATDAWGQVKEKVGALWRRFRPDQADAVAVELDRARDEVIGADETSARALTLYWESQLLRLLSADGAAAEELARVLTELTAGGTPQNSTVRQQAKATGRSVVIQVGGSASIGELPLTPDTSKPGTDR